MLEQTQRAAPLTGDDYLNWSDRLRDVEEILTDPDLRDRAAAIRDRAREMRKDVRRRSAEPNWDIVDETILEPLAELQSDVRRELLSRTSDELVPIDRVPVPPEYRPQVERYYERLGVGR